ncbi:MAG: glycosyltransferase family 39 protein [Hydrococcus sp. Prado102]|jgi:uncharacterized membrane protein|nr:glycosyltransferase family 39 protein [Hydrococcus sp. Prado102]
MKTTIPSPVKAKIAKQNFGFRWLKFFLIIVITIGIVFRFANLDKKIYWDDEIFTSLRVSGYTFQEVDRQLRDRVVSVEELQNYQYPNPEKTVFDTIDGLAKEEPQLPPLYFLLTRFWVQIFGNSVAITRSLSAVFNVLTIIAVYWLAQELFKSPIVGWMLMALIAVSPFHLLYAQTARHYSLWGLITVLSSLALLRAKRLNNLFNWTIYSFTIVLGLYTLPLFLLVAIAHGFYIIALESFQLNKIVRNYLVSFVFGFLIFTPWIYLTFISVEILQETIEWLNYSYRDGILELVFNWLQNITRLFIDLEKHYDFSYINPFPYIISVITIVTLIFYSIYFLCRRTNKETWLFILSLIIMTTLPIIGLDIGLGGKRSGITRYFVPSYLVFQISVAYFLATQLVPNLITFWQRQFWKLILIALLSLGIVSYTNISSAQVWWNNGASKIGQIPDITPIVERTTKPLIISDRGWVDLIALSYNLNSNVKYKLISQETFSQIPEGFSDYFFYKPSKFLQKKLKEKGYQIQPSSQFDTSWLWRLKKKK